MRKMFNGHYINAGTTEVYRYGKEAVRRASIALTANDKGYYSIPVDGGKYWAIGTSNGKYGEFAKFGDTFFSVNKAGFMYAKAGTEKGDAFVKAIEGMINYMHELNHARCHEDDDDEEEEE